MGHAEGILLSLSMVFDSKFSVRFFAGSRTSFFRRRDMKLRTEHFEALDEFLRPGDIVVITYWADWLLKKTDREDYASMLRGLYDNWIKPRNASFVAIEDTPMIM